MYTADDSGRVGGAGKFDSQQLAVRRITLNEITVRKIIAHMPARIRWWLMDVVIVTDENGEIIGREEWQVHRSRHWGKVTKHSDLLNLAH